MNPIAELKATILEYPAFKDLCSGLTASEHLALINCSGSGRAFVVSALSSKISRPLLCLANSEEEANGFYDDLSELAGEESVYLFSAHGKQLWNEIGAKSAVTGRRIATLQALLDKRAAIVVASATSVMEKVANPKKLITLRMDVETGAQIDFADFIEALVGQGYVREARVERPGEISVRGGIIDLFPFEEENPLRVEFFGNEVVSIRAFAVDSQISQTPVERFSLLPLGAAGLYGPYIDQPFDRLALTGTLFDYLSRETVAVLFDKQLFINNLESSESDYQVRFETFIEEHSLSDIHFGDFYLPAQSVEERVAALPMIDFTLIHPEHPTASFDFDMSRNSHFGGNLQLFRKEVEFQLKVQDIYPSPRPILVLCDSEAQTNRMQELLTQEGFPPQVVTVQLNLSEGFQWPSRQWSVYTNREIYSRVRVARVDKLGDRVIAFDEILKLKEGDWVVHVEYGVGIFRGLELISAYGKTRECIQIEYADGDRLYVPLEKMDLVQKFSSRDGYAPVLSKLGTKDWQRLKERTKKKVKEIAEQLIKLYASRKLRAGYAFSPDSVWQKELEASFIYEETLDQLNAIQEIKADMERPMPMDRLICGDVGFGKTEVAIRAAFKALSDGKQVAVLVPTTVLAQQHHATFVERLGRFPVTIKVLSRFKNAKEQSEILQELSAGEVDLIIGTHRLLSKDVKFKDLGLLIVDEEQKFGVVHKERLKIFKTTVDTITLSATPIPRTLHMALVGARDFSLINSPPNNRLSIRTEVCRFDKELIREVILNEADRGGQVFFVHNRVGTIYGMHHLLRELVPEIAFGVAHGQMKGHELEKVMMAFTEKKIQCLVSTMIIESGIDVPNANTLIVNRADRLGLAQLYQLRGRVGRSTHQAFAYFLVPPLRKLTRNAIKRLQTIQEYSHLGSGYKIAMRDLEIRGAGNIFGAEQSGFIDALGFELYAKIIEEAIQDLRGPVPEDKEKSAELADCRIDIELVTLLPADYVPAASDRVDIYRRLIEAPGAAQIETIRQEVMDRFGPLPEPAENLVEYLLLKEVSRRAMVEEVMIKKGVMQGKFNTRALPKGEHFKAWVGKMVAHSKQPFELKQIKNELYFEFTLTGTTSAIAQAKNFLQNII